jgi:hypothetical protein
MKSGGIFQSVKGDAPLGLLGEDEFGLSEMVEGFASILATRTPVSGYTIGIEGPWGSGKSTFANFVAERLRQYEDHIIIRFEPWLIGEKSLLIASFLGQFASEVDRLSPKQWSRWHYRRWLAVWRTSGLSGKIRRYGGYFGVLAQPIAGAAAIDPTGSAILAATGLKTANLLSRFFGKEESLDALKSRIVSELRALQVHRPSLRFTVMIDDTDRLDSAEAVEILRLARKAADFPLVSYVVCFDAKILSKQVSTALSIEDGQAYLERIFQDAIHIPPQEPFALRRYLKRLLKDSFPAEMGAHNNETQYRLEMVFDRWCGALLSTPRDVVRLHQAVQLAWPYVPDGSDFCDFVWLQLLKVKWQDFYEWVRNYLQNVGSHRDRGRPGDTESVEGAEKLITLLKRFGWQKRIYLSGLDEMLPGLKSPSLSEDGGPREVFKYESGELERYEQSRRLGSPTHWRGYFAFALPSYAVSDSELSAVRRAAGTDPAEAARIFRAALDRPHERAGHFLDVLLDRLLDDPVGFDEHASNGLVKAFAEVMDDVERATRWDLKEGRNEIWEKTRLLLRKNPPSNFLTALREGTSVNWLAYILRDQGFALGKPEGRRSNPENAWLNEADFQDAVRSMVERFETLGMKGAFALPAPMHVLLCWVQLGDSEDFKQRFHEATKTHAEFLVALGAMRGWASSSDVGVHHPIYAEQVAQFADPEAVRDRLSILASKGRPKHREIAQPLLSEWVPVGRW